MERVENLLVISNHYLTFVKDLCKGLSQFIPNIYVFVHHNYLSELAKYLPFSYFRYFDKFSKNRLIDLTVKPENVKVHVESMLYLTPDGRNMRLGDRISKKLEEFIQKNKIEFDLIHAHFTWPCGYVGVRLAKKYRVPLIITAHGYDIYDLPFRNDFCFNQVKYILDNTNHIITVSKMMKDIIVEKFDIENGNVSVIPNGFDPRLNYPINKIKVRQKLGLPLNKKIVLNVANLVPVKGQSYLIEAMEKVVKHRKDVLCVIVGDGMLKKDLEIQIKKLNLENYVKLVGAKPHSEIPLWMNAADLFILPSLSEGNPTVMFEALGVGLPFVGTKVGGIPEIITSEDYGILCEPANPNDLVEKISSLDNNWDCKKIREYAKQFTWDNIAKKILRVYRKVLSEK